jgi:16S rRNA (guanine1207-N2)-methyltransferase
MTKIPTPRAPVPRTTHYFNTPSADAQPIEPVAGAAKPGRRFPARAAGLTMEFDTGPGVFARSGLDEGSRLLLSTAHQSGELEAGRRYCDLGCGWGPIGCFLARLAPQAHIALVDINRAAVQLARENAHRNGLTNADLWCGDGLCAVRSSIFDAILCNPPVRAGNRVIEQLFDDAHRCLRPGGSLWVVLRTAQGAKSWARRLGDSWGNCESLAIEKGYRILRARKGAP